jgi:S-adenosylmethionine/arginine decarboxylase-like enzyme
MKTNLLVHKHLIVRAESKRPPKDEEHIVDWMKDFIVMHTWDELNPAMIQLDVYSCGEFDEHDICKKIAKDFELTKIEYKYLNRETGLSDISGGILNYRK